jgi:hypothetical protein
MEEVSSSLKISLLIFALALVATLGVMVVKNNEVLSGLEYTAAYE